MAVLIGRGGGILGLAGVVQLGSANDGGTSGTALSLTCTAAVALDQVIVVMAGWTGIAGDTCVFSDSGGNTYPATSDANIGSTASSVALSYTVIRCDVAALTTSSTITATVSASRAGRVVAAFKMNHGGLIFPVSVDVASSATGISTTEVPGNVTTTQYPDLAIFAQNNATAQTVTAPGGYTNRLSVVNFASTGIIELFTRPTTATLVLGPGPTITSTTWVAAQTAYRMDDSYARSPRGAVAPVSAAVF